MTTILIADDHDDVRQSIVLRLERRGFDVLSAKNGREAIELLRAARPDIVLMDMNMPEVDGWAASCQIKADGEFNGTPIIALTAYALPGDQARARQAGCDDYHAKPVDMPRLVSQIEALVERQKTG